MDADTKKIVDSTFGSLDLDRLAFGSTRRNELVKLCTTLHKNANEDTAPCREKGSTAEHLRTVIENVAKANNGDVTSESVSNIELVAPYVDSKTLTIRIRQLLTFVDAVLRCVESGGDMSSCVRKLNQRVDDIKDLRVRQIAADWLHRAMQE